MSITFQYNKTSLLALTKQLKIRQDALPILKNKESVLRIEVKRARDTASALEDKIALKDKEISGLMRLWNEFNPDLITVSQVHVITRKIAGVKIPILDKVDYELREYVMFNQPSWFLDGISLLKEVSNLRIERLFFLRKMHILEAIRKKTTQKVNLYEKVQIPEYEESILKIKRFLEDEENLSKSAQKILKNRMQQEAAV